MKRNATTVLAFLSLVFISATAMAAGGSKALITDPSVLVKMGFPADATNVYRAVDSATGGAEMDTDFGTVTHYSTLPAKAFIGRQNLSGSWQYTGGQEGCCQNLSAKGTETFADAPLDLPEGVLLTFVRFWGNDVYATDDMAFYLFEECYPAFGPGPTSTTVLVSTLATNGSSGNQSDYAGLSHTIDNYLCKYTMRVSFQDATTGLTLQKVRFQWNRQISPAPATASFTDVPTTAQFFREVEALAASGVTGGCTVPTFCPDQPVTRRQMAAFLSRALGL